MDGVLDGRWSEWFAGLQIDNRVARPSCPARCPISQHGILEKVRNLGLSIIVVRRTPPQGNQESNDETHPRPTAEIQAGTSVAGGADC